LTDYDEEMIDLASSIFILKYGNAKQAKQAQDLFKLSDSAIEALERYCMAPIPGVGANFLAIFNTDQGKMVQIITNTLSAKETWALSTTTEDMVLRDRLYEIMPAREARSLLALRFPTGECKTEVEAIKRLEDGDRWLNKLTQEILTMRTQLQQQSRKIVTA
jgi:intracellular multiplication protein IcmB